jgi:RimJ/RimL family protein N-acetyltransferase
VRITAHVFAFNTASARVLEKNAFICEGLQRKRFLKAGRFLDAKCYALVR